jgi:hypothetical protein
MDKSIALWYYGLLHSNFTVYCIAILRFTTLVFYGLLHWRVYGLPDAGAVEDVLYIV